MKKALRLIAVLVVVAATAFAVLPASAHVSSAGDLQLSVSGDSGVAAAQAGCTRITNRFCVQSTRSNCSACH